MYYKDNFEDVNSLQKKKDFNSLKPGEFAIFHTLNYVGSSLEHYNRPYFILGRTKEKIYGLYTTTTKKDALNYIINKRKENLQYIKCDEIHELFIDDFVATGWKEDYAVVRRIFGSVSKYIVDIEKVDYAWVNNLITKGAVVKKNENYYFVSDSSGKICTMNLLIPIDKSEKNKSIENIIFLDGKRWVIDYTRKITINKKSIDVVLKYIPSKIYFERKYKFGDVLSLDGSKDRVIYITQVGNNVYTCMLCFSEFFYGIDCFDSKRINQLIGEISDEEKEELLQIISEKFNIAGYVPERAKENIAKLLKRKNS